MKSLPPVAKIDPLDLFPGHTQTKFSPRHFEFFPRLFQTVPAHQNFSRAHQNFSRTYQSFFPDLPTCNFLTFRKFSQFCLSNSDFPTTFGHLSPKNVLLPFGGSYSHGFQRLMISIKIIKNCGGGGTYWPKLTIKIKSNSIQNCYLEHPTDNLRAKWIYLWRSSVKSSEPSQLRIQSR